MAMNKEEAIQAALNELEAMSPEELRAELDKFKDGPIVTALKEAQEFLYGEKD